MPRKRANQSSAGSQQQIADGETGNETGNETMQTGEALERNSEATPSTGKTARRGRPPGAKSHNSRAPRSVSRASSATPSTASGNLNLNMLQSQGYVALGTFIASMRACGLSARGISGIFNQHLNAAGVIGT